jgi:hypothetical protein
MVKPTTSTWHHQRRAMTSFIVKDIVIARRWWCHVLVVGFFLFKGGACFNNCVIPVSTSHILLYSRTAIHNYVVSCLYTVDVAVGRTATSLKLARNWARSVYPSPNIRWVFSDSIRVIQSCFSDRSRTGKLILGCCFFLFFTTGIAIGTGYVELNN